MEPIKGWKTSEFWVQNVVGPIVAALAASGIFSQGSVGEKILAFAAIILASFGYTAARTYLKATTVKADALKSAAANPTPKP